MTPTRALALSILLLLPLAACGGPQDPATEDLTADEHQAEAQREESLADEHEDQARRGVNVVDADYNPSDSQFAQADAHRVHAAAHRARAAQLVAFENEECEYLTDSQRSACPFLLGLQEVIDVEGGAKLVFGEAQNIDAIEHHIRCHLAFVAARGDEGISDCALYVHGATLTREANLLILQTDQEDEVDELRRRARVQEQH